MVRCEKRHSVLRRSLANKFERLGRSSASLAFDVPDCFRHFIHCRPFDLLQHPKELARQITLIDHGMNFKHLLVFEFGLRVLHLLVEASKQTNY